MKIEDLCFTCKLAPTCRKWLDIIREDNAEQRARIHSRFGTMTIVFACDDYVKESK